MQRPNRAAGGAERDGGGVLDVDRLAAGRGQLGLDAHDLLAGDEAQRVEPVAAQPGQDAAAGGFAVEQPGAGLRIPTWVVTMRSSTEVSRPIAPARYSSRIC